MSQHSKHMTRAEALGKADECRSLSLVAANGPQRIMMTHIAETWERIAAAIVSEH